MNLTWFFVFLVSLCILEWTAPARAQQLQDATEDIPPGWYAALDAVQSSNESDLAVQGAIDTFRQANKAYEMRDSRANKKTSWLGGK